MSDYTPVKKQVRVDAVFDQLRQRIVGGVIEPGDIDDCAALACAGRGHDADGAAEGARRLVAHRARSRDRMTASRRSTSRPHTRAVGATRRI